MPIEPAVWNAISEESTAWNEPSTTATATVHDRVPGLRRRLCSAISTPGGPGDVLARNRAADGLVLEDEALAGLTRLDPEHAVPVLAATTGLADEAALRALVGRVIVSR